MDEEPERERLCKKFAFELVTMMETKIIQMSAEQEIKKLSSNKTPAKTPSKSTATKEITNVNMEDGLLISLEQLYPWFMTYLDKGIFLLPEDKKLLPVSFDQFSEGDLAKVDELLEKIIRQRAYKRSLELNTKSALQDIESLSHINNSFDNAQSIASNAQNSFNVASIMYNNIVTVQPLVQQQGLGM
jgi:hypothetical protein